MKGFCCFPDKEILKNWKKKEKEKEKKKNLLGHRLNSLVLLDPLAGLLVVLGELLGQVRAHIAVGLLDPLCDIHRLVGGDVGLTLSQNLLDELSNAATGNGNVLDGRADNVTLSDRDDVGDTITRVNNGAGQGPLGDLVRGPGSGQRKHGLNSDVETWDVEGLEHDLGSVFTVLGGVERGLGLENKESKKNNK